MKKTLTAVLGLALGFLTFNGYSQEKTIKVGALKLIHSITPHF
jgi:hypothetical protein